jgi:hypothetical protein
VDERQSAAMASGEKATHVTDKDMSIHMSRVNTLRSSTLISLLHE